MKTVAYRTIAVIIVVVLFVSGTLAYGLSLFADGDDWVSFPVNRHAFADGVLDMGTVLDRDGYPLAYIGDNENRLFSDSYAIRTSTLHTVGDAEGNIGTGALSAYATELMAYDPINGVYSLDGLGNSVYLTIDASACLAAKSALGERRGAVAVYNYKTGEVLCMVSSPGFDPADPPDSSELDPEDGAYINRVISSSYAPGSVFKVVTLAAAIENIDDLFERSFTCSGSTEIGGEVITCSGVHGEIDIYEALACSCNIAFAQLSLELGGETLRKYAERAGLLDSFELSDIPVAAGRFDVAELQNDLAWSGIGQYNDLVNPLAMARLMGAAASGGRAVDPVLLMDVTTSDGIPDKVLPIRSTERLLKSATAAKLKEMLRYNVTDYYGESSFYGLNICAKSGTAEIKKEDVPHAWFAGFLDDEQHPFAFAVIVENGGWGLSAAGSVANYVLQYMVTKEY